jgi:DNA modification methylase
VAQNLGREFILIEGKQEYCDMAAQRRARETAQLNMFVQLLRER